MNIASRATTDIAIPFDQKRVDAVMDEAGIDVLLASSKHNVQYLLGGYKFIFFAAMDAIGHSRYLPVLIYEKGRPSMPAISATAWRRASIRCIRSGRRPCRPASGARSTRPKPPPSM